MTDRTIYADTPEEAARVREMLIAFNDKEWQAGSAEPWVASLIYMLIRASGARDAIEIGGFQGYTSERMARALLQQPWPTTLTICEIDQARAVDVQDKLSVFEDVDVRVVCDDSHRWIPTLPDRSIDFVWLDGNHEKAHVAREIELLLPKMRPNGLIVGHDAFGVCDLAEVFARYGGYSLDLPRLGPAGGIGLLQVRA